MSSRRERARRHKKTSGLVLAGRIGVVLVVLSVIVLTAGVTSGYAILQSWLEDLPDYNSPEAFEVAQATKIYSADGVLLARLYLENRTVVPMSRIASDLADAIVAVEDERFYEHRGVDYPGLARAAVVDIMAGAAEEGASTITQQYVDNTLLLQERTDRTIRYKVREMFLASELEKRKSKQEILELYLNTVYFGEGAYGAQAAAQAYFATDAIDLTLPQAALIAGLAQAPSRLSPYDNPDGALARRNMVLDRMLANNLVTTEEHAAAVATPLEPKRAHEPEGGIYKAHYFVAHVKKILQQQFEESLVFRGGLTVHTTLDTKKQAMAESSVKSSLGSPGDPDCSLVSIDPRNGHIIALVGGRDFAKNKFNLATQGKRQPGSSFKTFVLVTALENGMPPNRYIDSSSPAYIPTKPVWNVSNSEGSGRGMITLESATRSSVNTVFARLVWDLNDKKETGAAKVVKVAKRMGIATKLSAYPSLALGSQNVSPLEMASAYGTLATNGEHFAPIAITKVVGRDGKTIMEAKPEPAQALEPEIAYATTSILKGVITNGTARRAQIGRPAAGKTGTSQNYRDAWFVGYTPQLVTSVWVGYYQSEKPMRSVHGVRGFGGTLAAPIWAKFMKQALADEPKLDFPAQAKPKYRWKSTWAATSKVPSLAGMTRSAASAAAAQAGFKAAFTEAYSDSVPTGKAISQSPGSGSTLKQGGTITVVISKGKSPTPVAPKPEAPQPPPPPPPPSEPTTP